MTKKHYEAIAQAIKYQREHGQPHNARWQIADLLADYFQQDNPKFNRDMFLTACGIEQKNMCTMCNEYEVSKDYLCTKCLPKYKKS